MGIPFLVKGDPNHVTLDLKLYIAGTINSIEVFINDNAHALLGRHSWFGQSDLDLTGQ